MACLSGCCALRAALLLLAQPVLRVSASATAADFTAALTTKPLLRLFVDPALGQDEHGGLSASSALRTLGSAQQRLRQHLSEHPESSIVVELLPGRHRVPHGGLVLDARDSPADGQRVVWRGQPGLTSLSGGEPVTGWKPVTDPSLPKGVYAAPAPAALRNTTARHLFVDDVRATRTRRNATTALPGLALETRADCPACSY
eukprot:COSAG05_NODE_8070_length_739_cov_1.109375_1_plen_200_part_01